MADHKLAYGRAQLDRGDLVAGQALDGPLTFTASTTGLNRYGFRLRNEGWRLDNFNANPVMLWMHNPMQPPLARGRALSKNPRLVIDEVTFDRDDEQARMVESKYRRGFLSAVSVGWDFVKEDGSPVLDWWRLSNEQIHNELFYDLAEVSFVTVPGDPGALQQQSRLALASLGKELVELFDEQEVGTITQPELQAAVAAELERLGVRLDPQHDPNEKPGTRAEDVHPDADGPVGLDQQAARTVLAAFDLQMEEETQDG
ncbi:MAG TPA: hypothetical protein VGX25_05455 [Actinophytocola sp.]|uniref:hypothetical protein n=1 Tax=Actinophytocola sp. TaxID=1872138 RepID=UPI002DDD3BAC|nr:hypothetical protein [Actinophytocola sp.]HEV2778829.1 hypothetical protein [Actinophytocola sp.]